MTGCLRCGYCCKGHICLVPKHETSNLSPEFLETVDTLYIDENIEEQGAYCKWLTVNEKGIHSCTAYNRRSSMCIDYNSEIKVCRIGYNYWSRKGFMPDEISNIMEK